MVDGEPLVPIEIEIPSGDKHGIGSFNYMRVCSIVQEPESLDGEQKQEKYNENLKKKALLLKDRIFRDACRDAFEHLEDRPHADPPGDPFEFLKSRDVPVAPDATEGYLVQYLLLAIKRLEHRYASFLPCMASVTNGLTALRHGLNQIQADVSMCSIDMNNMLGELQQRKETNGRRNMGARMRRAVQTLTATSRLKLSPFRLRRNKILTDVVGDEDVVAWLRSSLVDGRRHDDRNESFSNSMLCLPASPSSRSSMEASQRRTEAISLLGEPRTTSPLRPVPDVIQTLAGSDAESLVPAIDAWAFDQPKYIGDSSVSILARVGVAVLSSYTLWDTYNLTVPQVMRFFEEVARGYNSNPYHCSEHATDVVQTLHSMLCGSELVKHFSDKELFTLVISAACHDYAHPGIDNQCLGMIDPHFVQLFQCDSTLEKVHVALSFPIIQQHFGESFGAQLQSVYSLMGKLVGGTDVSKQSGLISSLGKDDPSHVGLMTLLLHAADVSNPAKPFSIYMHWTQRVMTEFFLQGDVQRESGLRVSPMCDSTAPIMRKCQLGFIGIVVKPLYAELNEWFDLSEQLQHINENTDIWGKDGSEEQHLPSLMEGHASWRQRVLSAQPTLRAALDSRLTSLYQGLLRVAFPTLPCDSVTVGGRVAFAPVPPSDPRASGRSRGAAGGGCGLPCDRNGSRGFPAASLSRGSGRVVYHYPGVERTVEPMFSVLKVEKEYMPFESYPVRLTGSALIPALVHHPMSPQNDSRGFESMSGLQSPRTPDLPFILGRQSRKEGGSEKRKVPPSVQVGALGGAGVGQTAGDVACPTVKIPAAAIIETQVHGVISKLLVSLQKKCTLSEQTVMVCKMFGKCQPLIMSTNDILDSIWHHAVSKWQLSKKQSRNLRAVWGKWLKERTMPALPDIVSDKRTAIPS